MLGIVLKVLSILGIVLLVLLGLLILGTLLVLFCPITYRIRGSRDEAGLRLCIRVNWLFGLLRLRYRYPEPGRLTAKALWFRLLDIRIPGEKGDGSGKEAGGRRKKAVQQETAEEGAGGRKGKKGLGAQGSGQAKAEKKTGPKEAPEKGDDQAGGQEAPGKADGQAGQEASGKADGQAGQEASGKGDGQAGQEPPGKGDGQTGQEASASAAEESGNGQPETGGTGSGDASADEVAEDSGPLGKISQKIRKIWYTICNIYDKIKKIWKNISYYVELLQEENTRQLVAHARKRAGKILKSIRPKRVRADITFGTGAPDTTGYLYGAYCAASALLGTGFWLTPDFERRVLEGEFDVAGHVTVWVFFVNGLRLLLDRRLRVLIRKLKAGLEKAPA